MKIIKLLKGLLQHITKNVPSPKKTIEPVIIPRTEHNISRKQISHNALKVLYRLHEAGFGAYLVGGCVRDLLFGQHPKDFDIATDARPEEVRKLFKNCRLIGKRFRIAHVVFGRDIIEVTTFRTHHHNAEEQHARTHKGMIIRDNVFGPIEDDAERRDFTINALYYNIADFSVVDYTGGMHDIKLRMLRIIGDPEKRFHEDPVRLLRAARFMGKLQLQISPETEEPITRLSHLLQQVSSARLFLEVLKLFEGGALPDTVKLLKKYHLLAQLFPQTVAVLQKHPTAEKFLEHALVNTETRIQDNKTVSPAFLFAAFLWYPIQEQAAHEEKEGFPTYVAYERAIHIILKNQTTRLAIPRQMQVSIRDICFLQHRFTQRQGMRPFRILEHPRFRAAFDLLMLRAETGEPVKELYDWWQLFYTNDSVEREKMIKEVSKSRTSRKRRKPRKFSRKHTSVKHEQI